MDCVVGWSGMVALLKGRGSKDEAANFPAHAHIVALRM
jgi:hypothetical protein